MTPEVKIAFERLITVLPVTELLPLRSVPQTTKNSVKFKRIVRSIAEVGLIEPLVVARPKAPERRYLLLDGHLRHAALVEALGLPSYAVGLGYGYVTEGEVPDGLEPDRLFRVE